MRRVVPLKCDSCGKTHPDFESTRWNLRLCYSCLLDCSTYLWSWKMLIPNPLTEELFDGVFSGGWVTNEEQYSVTHRTQGVSTFGFVRMKRVGK